MNKVIMLLLLLPLTGYAQAPREGVYQLVSYSSYLMDGQDVVEQYHSADVGMLVTQTSDTWQMQPAALDKGALVYTLLSEGPTILHPVDEGFLTADFPQRVIVFTKTQGELFFITVDKFSYIGLQYHFIWPQ